MNPVVLFRSSLAEEGELDICRKYFRVYEQRSEVPMDSLVIGRYSVLPYYKELENDLAYFGCNLINDYEQHRWIANFEYYNELGEYTFDTWFDDDFYKAPEGEYVCKGRTNSRKFAWNRLMYAKNKREALRIAGDLMNDGIIGEQGIIYRKYVPLETFEIGVNGIRFCNEWRMFFYKENLLCTGFYWSIAENIPAQCPPELIEFAKEIAQIAACFCNFFVLDVAITQDQNPILVEINDGQQSGLSECNPDILYFRLKEELRGR